MPIDRVSPKEVQSLANRGVDRLHNFRCARVLFIRNYVGQYYDQKHGLIGEEPLGLIYNAIRAFVPHVVMNFPKQNVTSNWVAHKDYAEMLALELMLNDKDLDIKTMYRCLLVDALFTLGIAETGLAQSDSIYTVDEYDRYDPGEVFTKRIDFDNFIVDPRSEEHLFADAAFVGSKKRVSRSMLLDSGLYNNDLIERLPSCSYNSGEKKARDLSMRGIKGDNGSYDLDDEVEVAELWVPDANAIITIPGDSDVEFEDYLRVDDYYGPKSGPFTYLAFSPPVPGNPIPVVPVGVWNDLHILANNMASKIAKQADRQKDVMGYRRASADDAKEIQDAKDGEMIAMDDPDAVKTYSFGGQKNSNEAHLAQLQTWFSMMAQNPEQLMGAQSQASSATAANIMQSNASITLEDSKDMMYQVGQTEAGKRAWFLHNDPLRETPLARRVMVPAQWQMGMGGPQLIQPQQFVDEQIVLTPEMRRGDWLNFTFTFEPESMGRKDSKMRFAQGLDFITKVIPAVFGAAQAASAMGVPFSPQATIIYFGKLAGLEWIEECFADPAFQMQAAMLMQAGPQPTKGQMAPQGAGAGRPNLMQEIMQNGQPADLPFNAPPDMQARQEQQAGAVTGQQMAKMLAPTGAY